jgi:hypothetical protein
VTTPGLPSEWYIIFSSHISANRFPGFCIEPKGGIAAEAEKQCAKIKASGYRTDYYRCGGEN